MRTDVAADVATKEKKALFLNGNRAFSDPYGTRTRVAAVKGRSPRPLDEGAVKQKGH